ncbi:MAG: polysaccharide deacetylase family protein [Armatimonadetes bacterium]|nr:polysaccharide deacetylase family protein [Armatimonadota bacterium]MDE2207617.1 polysaccharide deacetylase family protein [Armatimonadota bacterium]
MPIAKREAVSRLLRFWPVGFALRPVLHKRDLICLNYHRVIDSTPFDDGVISASTAEFERQLQWLRTHVPILNEDEALRMIRGEADPGAPVAVITFDDGYADNYAAACRMAELGVPGIFFIATGFIESGVLPYWDRIARSVKRAAGSAISFRVGDNVYQVRVGETQAVAARNLIHAYRAVDASQQELFLQALEQAAGVQGDADSGRDLFMTWEQLRQFRGMGHGIGAHTHSHPTLSALPVEEQLAEMKQSRDILRRQLGWAPRTLAYPVGTPAAFNSQSKAAAKEAGFEAAFSFYGGRNPRGATDIFDVRRLPVSPDISEAIFQTRITSGVPW